MGVKLSLKMLTKGFSNQFKVSESDTSNFLTFLSFLIRCIEILLVLVSKRIKGPFGAYDRETGYD
jgi:hypothetical protein